MKAILGGQELEERLLPSVRQWLDWRLFNTLPHSGGTLDQDPLFMNELRFILNVEASEEQDKTKVSDALSQIKADIKEKTGRK